MSEYYEEVDSVPKERQHITGFYLKVIQEFLESDCRAVRLKQEKFSFKNPQTCYKSFIDVVKDSNLKDKVRVVQRLDEIYLLKI